MVNETHLLHTMFTRILSQRQVPRLAFNNYRLLNTSSASKLPQLNVNLAPKTHNPNSISFTSSDSSQLHPQPQLQSSSKKWSRHVIKSSQELNDQLDQQAKEEDTKKLAHPTTGKKTRKRRTLKPLKAPITLTENAKVHLRALNDGPEPKLIRISVKNRGCSGLTYHLEYIDKPDKFDEIVEQDGIKVVIDSKALFSIIGSEMDWVDNKLSSKFVFKNPNSKGTCGCGESFMV